MSKKGLKSIIFMGGLFFLLMALPYGNIQKIALGEPSKDLIEKGKKVFESEDAECNNCHKLAGKGGSKKKKEPDLDNIGSLLSMDDIKKKVMNPNCFMATGYDESYKEEVMPRNFSEILSKDQIEAVAAFLSVQKNTSGVTPKPIPQKC